MRHLAWLHTFWGGIVSVLVILGLNIVLDQVTHTLAGDIVALVYFGLSGLYCLQNYFRCREYHCLITGPAKGGPDDNTHAPLCWIGGPAAHP